MAHNRQALGLHEYLGNQVYKDVCHRFYHRHKIKLPDHIAEIYKVGKTLGESVEFRAHDHKEFERLLRMPSFSPDDRSDLCGRIASGATHGQGYRETTVPSLHVAVAPDVCSVHIDTFGFVAVGPNGRASYNLDAIQHTVDELLMQDLFVGWVEKRRPGLGSFLRRVHPVLPNSRNRYRLAGGLQINLKDGPGWSVAIEATGSIKGEGRAMLKGEIFSW